VDHIRRVATALVVATASMAMNAGPADACSFAPPALAATPTTVTAGEAVAVRGTGFLEIDPTPPSTTTTVGTEPPIAECSDTVPGGPVQLQLVQDARTQDLAVAQPGADHSFAVTVTVPAGVRPGPATLVATADYLGSEVLVVLTVQGAAPPVVEPDYAG
jgi:hypothetical protein